MILKYQSLASKGEKNDQNSPNEEDKKDKDKKENENEKQDSNNRSKRKPVSRPKPTFFFSSIHANNITKSNGTNDQDEKNVENTNNPPDLLSLEIRQLTTRFKDLKRNITNQNHTLIDFTFPIHDPYFPFDIESLNISVNFPPTYPLENGKPILTISNPFIPDHLISHLNLEINTVLKGYVVIDGRGEGGELLIRRILHYLEIHLEELLSGKKGAGGIKFIQPKSILSFETANQNISKESMEIKTRNENTIIDIDENENHIERSICNLERLSIDNNIDSDESLRNSNDFEQNNLIPSSFQSNQRILIKKEGLDNVIFPSTSFQGSIKLNIEFRVSRGVSLCLLSEPNLTIVCSRCKGIFLKSINRPYADIIISCPKCFHSRMSLNYHLKLMSLNQNHGHGQKMETLAKKETFKEAALLKTHGLTIASQLGPSTWQIECDHCMTVWLIKELKIGELIKISCNCNEILQILVDGIEIVSISNPLSLASKSSKAKNNKNVNLKVGEPLANNGSCQHYKKSFKWYRFPCCGMAFPCDSCHDDQSDHKFTWANRYICGWCSREHNIGRSCECNQQTLKNSAFWEGGKGMRDQQRMSKKDNKKYRNVTKTIAVKK